MAPLTTVARWWRGLRDPARRINLALQGGGAHGAFTWGVLDALLEDGRLQFEGLSGSSAGAMNAVVMADGWAKGGRDGARQGLADFWAAVGRQLPASMVSQREGDDIALAPVTRLLAQWAACFSPSQLNPLDHNPLRDLIRTQVDFEALRRAAPFKLFIGATQAASGRLRVFRERELTAEMVLASACLPRIHHAVQIEGEPYWDGGYSANPAVFPLVFDCAAADVLLVLLSPLKREGTPRTVAEIETRLVELAFSAHFMREMRLLVQTLDKAGPGLLGGSPLERRLRGLRLHMIDNTQLPSLERTDTQLLAYGPFLERLRDQGRERGRAWLERHLQDVGRQTSIPLRTLFG
ncbi:Ferredoxin reductase [Rubrivivax sp. A210]|uniref:patatin-like phospholipase family protein n=1 Tax=Rubrivivax sp. A210 TaxID=2772301 RepID=UPI00191B2246|nr:patatin-like phospholipase family protein [Rubrivivax sp. A210]CAD5365857.1 Ferredoxin reductase [Rubrivivax sp. A210]